MNVKDAFKISDKIRRAVWSKNTYISQFLGITHLKSIDGASMVYSLSFNDIMSDEWEPLEEERKEGKEEWVLLYTRPSDAVVRRSALYESTEEAIKDSKMFYGCIVIGDPVRIKKGGS